MLGVESEIDKPNHSGVGLRHFNDEALRLDTPGPHRSRPETRLCPLSITFVHYGLDIVDRGRLVVERGESYDGSIVVVERYLPGLNSMRIRAVW